MALKRNVVLFAAGSAIAAALALPAAAAGEPAFTQAQLDKGKSEYNTHCRTCHAANGKGALGPALHGDVFKARFGGGTATDARTWIHDYMPQTAPGSLKDEQLDPIMAFILSLNGYTAGDKEFTAESGKAINIEK